MSKGGHPHIGCHIQYFDLISCVERPLQVCPAQLLTSKCDNLNYTGFLPREGRDPRGLHVAFQEMITPELQVNAAGAFFSRKNFWRENSNELKCIVSA